MGALSFELEEVSDEGLIKRHLDGDPSAFTELVRRHQKAMYFFALRMTRSEEDARDLSQKAFIRAFKALDRFEGRSSFSTWMHRIIGNLCRNHHRDTTRVEFVPMEEDRAPQKPFALGALVRNEERSQLRAAVELLPPRQRSVLQQRVYEELSFKEIAAREGISEGNARVSYHLAVKALRTGAAVSREEVVA